MRRPRTGVGAIFSSSIRFAHLCSSSALPLLPELSPVRLYATPEDERRSDFWLSIRFAHLCSSSALPLLAELSPVRLNATPEDGRRSNIWLKHKIRASLFLIRITPAPRTVPGEAICDARGRASERFLAQHKIRASLFLIRITPARRTVPGEAICNDRGRASERYLAQAGTPASAFTFPYPEPREDPVLRPPSSVCRAAPFPVSGPSSSVVNVVSPTHLLSVAQRPFSLKLKGNHATINFSLTYCGV